MLFNFRTCLQRGGCDFNCNWSRSSGSARRRIGMHNGHRRRVGWVFGATSSGAARKTTIGKYLVDHCDPDSVRSVDPAGEHGSPSLRINRRVLSRPYPRPASCSPAFAGVISDRDRQDNLIWRDLPEKSSAPSAKATAGQFPIILPRDSYSFIQGRLAG